MIRTLPRVAADLARQMLRRAPAHLAPRPQADAARLPLATGSIAAVVLVDALLFPAEITRVMAADGVLIRANQLGTDGPLFLDTPTAIGTLGGAWSAVQAGAGGGRAVLRRAGAAGAHRVSASRVPERRGSGPR
ncbi:hypothetical protein GCM10009733_046810 [Nonomuraea maheshkhaliensis]|uniref:Uncharacterized protein n=1 Tax=Nonomuraea maheshkhaliensis TaxID=419590 RepID=A0ABP4RHN0_9ACTN